MQTYLLSANLFALTALFLGLNAFAKGRLQWRLLPLFLLVVSRSFIFIIFFTNSPNGQSQETLAIMAALDVLSAVCVVWALINPFSDMPDVWRRAIWLAGGAAFFLIVFPLIPGWPVPYQLNSLIVAVVGAPLILVSLGQIGWMHLAAVLFLAVATFFSLVGLTNVSWLIQLIAYGFLIGALHWESLQRYKNRQAVSEAMAREAVYISRERQRLVEVSEVISTIPSFDDAMIHIARSMAHITHSDQAAIFVLTGQDEDQAQLVAIYSPERPVDLRYQDHIIIELTNCLPLQAAMQEYPQQVLAYEGRNVFNQANLRGIQTASPQWAGDDIIQDVDSVVEIDPASLSSLYSLWGEDRTGPTLIQPLTVKGKSVGVLVLGNPVTRRLIRENDQALCESLSPQISTIVEAYHRFIDLELQVELLSAMEQDPIPAAFVEAMQDDAGQSKQDISPEPELDEVDHNITGLEEEWDHYLAILETVDDGVVVSNANGRVQMVNRAAERILGKTRSELLDQPISAVYGEIDSGEPIENLAVAFSRSNKPLPTYKEDDERAIQGRIIPWRNAGSEWLGIIAVFRDVSYQIKSDKARNNSITALSRVLRGPLAIIKGYAELITAGSIGEYTSEQLKIQQIIHSNAERMAATLDNAVQISMQNKRALLPRFEEVIVNKIIEEVVYAINPTLQLSELKLVQDIKADLPVITADPRHLYRILENLLSNACRFTPPGGQVTLRAWVQQEREGSLTRPHLMFAVADNGVGIAQTEQKRIFEPFYQLGNQNPGDKPGLGMGLAVVKELVEWHNGRVWVESMPGEGSIFQVALPLRQH